MKQLSAGIYSTMNMHDYNESMTGRAVYDKIQRGELDNRVGRFATFFSDRLGTHGEICIPMPINES